MSSLNRELELYLNGAEKVGIFFGSFDPFHCGHREVVDVCLEHYCNRLICGAIKMNQSKPNLSCHKRRYELLKMGLQGSSAFLFDNRISNMHIDQIAQKIKKQFPHIIALGIIGSDAYLKSLATKKFPRMKVDQFIVVPRRDYPIKEITDSKFALMDATLFTGEAGLTLSSTHIRESINKAQKVDTTHLHPESAKYICDHLMYRDLTSLLHAHVQGEITTLSRGISGHHVFLVGDRIVKIFTDIAAGILEVEMLKWMHKNDIPTIRVFDYVIESTYSMAITEWIPNAQLFETCSEGVFELAEEIGKTLRRIHDSGCTDITNLEFWIKMLKSKNIETEHFQKNPGRAVCWLYGDLNLSNILVRDGKLIFIDPEPFQNGIPAYDYYRFLSSARKHPQWAIIYRGFIQGYGFNNGMTPESTDVFTRYWNVQSHLEYIKEEDTSQPPLKIKPNIFKIPKNDCIL